MKRFLLSPVPLFYVFLGIFLSGLCGIAVGVMLTSAHQARQQEKAIVEVQKAVKKAFSPGVSFASEDPEKPEKPWSAKVKCDGLDYSWTNSDKRLKLQLTVAMPNNQPVKSVSGVLTIADDKNTLYKKPIAIVPDVSFTGRAYHFFSILYDDSKEDHRRIRFAESLSAWFTPQGMTYADGRDEMFRE